MKGTKGNWRGAILGALYGLVECQSPKVLLAVARVVLGLGVTGSNLTGACKLVFKVARNEVNDSLFIDSGWFKRSLSKIFCSNMKNSRCSRAFS